MFTLKASTQIFNTLLQDPSLIMPRSLLPPLAEGVSEDDRKNVKFESMHGGIDVSLTLLGDAQDPSVNEITAKKRTSLDMNSEHGSINLKIVRSSFSINFLLWPQIKWGVAHLSIVIGRSNAIPSQCDWPTWSN
jgi:hypothetical protein